MGGDYRLRMQFEIEAPPEAVARWLDSPEGIAGWWSDRVEGAAARAGDSFRVTFPTTPVTFELDVTKAGDGTYEWHVPESPPWWKGTTIRFDLAGSDEGGGSQLMFTHEGFDPEDPIIPVITPAWARFLDNLAEVAKTGRPNPAVVN